MSLLTIAQDAAGRIGLQIPTAVASSTGDTERQLFRLASQEGKELARRAPWQALVTEQTFTSTATETQSGAIPADFDRMLNETFYNRSRKRQVLGPLSPTEWQAQKGIIATVLYDSYRIRGSAILLLPTPPAGETYAFEYVSKNWCQSSGGTGQTAFAADTDTALIDEELITLGLIWRFKRAKGLDYAEDFRTYEVQVAQAITRDGSKRTLNFAQNTNYHKPRYPGVNDGSWNLS